LEKFKLQKSLQNDKDILKEAMKTNQSLKFVEQEMIKPNQNYSLFEKVNTNNGYELTSVYLDKSGKFKIVFYSEGDTNTYDYGFWSGGGEITGTFEIKDSKIYWIPLNGCPWESDLYCDIVATLQYSWYHNECNWMFREVILEKLEE
jgi:hypothetical protein